MDITYLIGNAEFLKQLSLEFKTLKAAKANVDYNDWMRQRLREFCQQQMAGQAQPQALTLSQPPAPAQQSQSQQPFSQRTQPPYTSAPAQASTLQYASRSPPAVQPKQAPVRPTIISNNPVQRLNQLELGQARQQPREGTWPLPRQWHVPGSAVTDSQIQAAQERDRRLAIFSSTARQQVALGIQAGVDAPAGNGSGGGLAVVSASPAVMTAATAEAVLDATRQLKEQQASVMALVSATQQQLNEHKDLLKQVASVRVAPISASMPTSSNPAPPPARHAPFAWFIPPPVAGSAAGTASAPHLVAAPTEPLQVMASLSPTGQLRKGQQQRKRELKIALKRLLFEDPRPTQSRGYLGPQAEAGRSGGGQHGIAGSGVGDDEQLVRHVLMRLIGRGAGQHGEAAQQGYQGGMQHQPPVHNPNLGPQFHNPQVHQDRHGSASGPSSYSLREPHEIHAVEEEAAQILKQDRAAAQEEARHERMSHMEAQLQAIAEQVAQVAKQLKTPTGEATSANTNTPAPAPTRPHLGTVFPEKLVYPTGRDGQQRQQQPQEEQAGSCVLGTGLPVNPTSTNNQLVENPRLMMHRLLAQLQQLEEAEATVRRKWLQAPGGSQQPSSFTVQSATLHATQTMPTAPMQQTEQEQSCKTGAVSVGTVVVPGALKPLSSSSVAHGRDPVTNDVVDAVQEGRRRYLEYQHQVDGLTLSSALGQGVRPQDVVEDVAEVLLDELLMEEAQGEE